MPDKMIDGGKKKKAVSRWGNGFANLSFWIIIYVPGV
jgi:hypothetical protein